jgi:hypothetical protein
MNNIPLPRLRPTLAAVVRAPRRRPMVPIANVDGVRGARSGVSSYENKWGASSLTTRRNAATSINGEVVGGGGGSGGGGPPRSLKEIWKELKTSPMQYATIPAVAAFLGLYTNWVGVKMLFYPIEYTGTEWYVLCLLFWSTRSSSASSRIPLSAIAPCSYLNSSHRIFTLTE